MITVSVVSDRALKYRTCSTEKKNCPYFVFNGTIFLSNDQNLELEGFYVFTLPEGATVDGLWMWLDGKRYSFLVKRKEDAQAIYDSLQQNHLGDPVILESMGRFSLQQRHDALSRRYGDDVCLAGIRGLSWTRLNGTGEISEIAVHPQNENIIYFSAIGTGVMRSTNGGIAWTSVSRGLPTKDVMRVRIAPGYPVCIFAVTLEHGAYRMVDEELSEDLFVR